MNVLCEVDSDGEEGLFALREVGTSAMRKPPPSHLTRRRRRKGRVSGMWEVSTC